MELLEPRRVFAAGFAEFVDPHPADGNQFGASVVPLATGNVVVTSPFDDAGGTDAGAVYLFSGRTGELISTLIGSHVDDHVGSGGITALTNGNYVVASPDWDSDTTLDVGAATWGSGVFGVGGTVSAANSLVGATEQDKISYAAPIAAFQSGIFALTNGNYVVVSTSWDNGDVADVGAVTWADGTTGIRGEVTPENSLFGTTTGDQIGGDSVLALANGNYVVMSRSWDNDTVTDAGAATFGNGATGIRGAVSEGNSLVGDTKNDRIGFAVGVPNGNYLVRSSGWHSTTGAVTFASGTTGISGRISADNSLIGSTPGDRIGGFIKVLNDGDYVVVSTNWTNGTKQLAGAVTFGSGTTGISGVVGPDISLVGDSTSDNVGSGGVFELSNGNYVVRSQQWHGGFSSGLGAVTLADGTTGIHGTVSDLNSLVGSRTGDRLGSGGVTVLTNGNYVVASPFWDDGGVADVGAVTFASGLGGAVGQISSDNSLVGSTAGDQIGGLIPASGFSVASVFALKNGNYIVRSPLWDDNGVQDVGAVTFGNGVTGITGPVSESSSLFGTTEGDNVGGGDIDVIGALALANGNYVVASPNWDDGSVVDVGAVTFGNGQMGIVGPVSKGNSFVGSTANDHVGGGDIPNVHLAALPNGNYVIGSPNWDNGSIVDAGAVTFVDGLTGISGVVSAANSLVGSNANDRLSDPTGANFGIQVLANGNYLVTSTLWDNGPATDAGTLTFGDSMTGVVGPVNATNSALGESANSDLQDVVVKDSVNQNFYARFLADGGGRVVAGSQIDGFSQRWHLAIQPQDVNNDGHIAADDVIGIINYINAGKPTDVGSDAEVGGPYGFLDVTGDDVIAADDVITVINYINAHPGEQEAAERVAGTGLAGSEGESGGGGDVGAVDVDALLLMLAADAVGARRRG
jgi:hypothetical protein